MQFLADESCDFAVVKALRRAGHDVSVVAEVDPGADDAAVLALARSESRLLLTEDKDFGLLAYAGGHQTAGVALIRFPGGARRRLGEAVVSVVDRFGDRLSRAFVVIEPGRARLSAPKLGGIHCSRCKSWVQIPNVVPQVRAEVARLRFDGHLIEAWQRLQVGSGLDLRLSKQIVLHLPNQPGMCHRCSASLPTGEAVVCSKCKSVNIQWGPSTEADAL